MLLPPIKACFHKPVNEHCTHQICFMVEKKRKENLEKLSEGDKGKMSQKESLLSLQHIIV